MARTGRPPTINQRAGPQRPDGTWPTAADIVIERLRIGLRPTEAAISAGIDKDTFFEWMKVAGRALIRTGRPGAERLTVHETRCIEFSARVDRAMADYEAACNALIEQVARGGLVRVTTTIKVDGDGNEVEQSTKSETLLPDADLLMRRLAVRFPDRYSRRVELTGVAGGPVEVTTGERARDLADNLAAFQAGAQAQAEVDAAKENGHA